jgi:hypothetical protein
MVAENAQEHAHVSKIWDISESQCLRGKQRRDHQRKRRVLRSGNSYEAIQPLAANDTNTIQYIPRSIGLRRLNAIGRGACADTSLCRAGSGVCCCGHICSPKSLLLPLLSFAAEKVRPKRIGETLARPVFALTGAS